MPRWSRVIVHHSAGHDREELDLVGIERFHVEERGWRAVGYHFLVEQVHGRFVAIAGRPLYWSGSHCRGQNGTAIGVCLVGDLERDHPPEGQLEEAARLVAGLCYALGIPVAEVHGHRDHASTACPGRWLDLDLFRARVARHLE